MLTVSAALELILSHASPCAARTIATSEALGLVLAEDIASDIDSPPWDKSLMDGYAIQSADATEAGATLTILEEITAGKVPTREVVRGTCTRIMTGAPLPQGADAVVMIERTELAGEQVKLLAPAKPEQNLLRRGASMRRGEVVLHQGQTIRPTEIGVLAEVGRTEVSVVRQPCVAILATGDELVDASRSPAPGQIRNSNGPMLAALVAASGAEPVLLGIARDNADDLAAKIDRGLAADVLVLSGGVSAGLLDLVPKTLASQGVREVFHKVELKPGKPLWFGAAERDRQTTLVFGLPGNPVSTLVCFGLFVKPALARLAGRTTNDQPRLAALTEDYQQRDARPTYFPSRRSFDGHCDVVTPLPWRGSADLRALADANCLAFFPGGEKLYAAGELVPTYSV
jgi:molybdopterin molybdotransferase